MGNARGNTFSRNHVSLLPSGTAFWDFSWHEIGEFVVININYASFSVPHSAKNLKDSLSIPTQESSISQL